MISWLLLLLPLVAAQTAEEAALQEIVYNGTECLSGGGLNFGFDDVRCSVGAPFSKSTGTIDCLVNALLGGTIVVCSRFTCAPGFDIQRVGDAPDISVVCVKKSCDTDALVLTQGTISVNPLPKFLDVATFSCNPGYVLSGPSSVQCLATADGQLAEFQPAPPTCVDEDECVTQSPCSGPGFECTNTIGGFFCSCSLAGFTLENNVCIGSPCETLDLPDNGSHSYVNPTTDLGGGFKRATFPNNVTLTCDTGFEPIAPGVTLSCGSDGLWTPSDALDNGLADFNCRGVACPPVPPIADGVVEFVGFDAEPADRIVRNTDVVAVHCNAGYEIIGTSAQVQCTNGVFSPALPTCQGVACPELPTDPTFSIVYDPPAFGTPAVQHYGFDPNLAEPFTGKATYQCIPGFVIDNSGQASNLYPAVAGEVDGGDVDSRTSEVRFCHAVSNGFGFETLFDGPEITQCVGRPCSVGTLPANTVFSGDVGIFPSDITLDCAPGTFSVAPIIASCDANTGEYTNTGAGCVARSITGVSNSNIVGGTPITIDGVFGSASIATTTVTFGSVAEPARYNCAVSAVSSTKITCTPVVGFGANLRITATTEGLVFSSATVLVTYPAPVLSTLVERTSGTGTLLLGISPADALFQSSRTFGEDELAITGVNFGDNPSLIAVELVRATSAIVRACTVTSVTDTRVEFTTPPGDGSDHKFRITVFGQSGPTSFNFNYGFTNNLGQPTAGGPTIFKVQAPGCSDVDPKTEDCPTNGGNRLLTVTGTGFASTVVGQNPPPVVTLGRSECVVSGSRITYEGSDSQFTCTMPEGAGADQTLTVIQSGLSSSPTALVSFAAPSIDAVEGCNNRNDCVRTGGDRITIRGTNFGILSRGVEVFVSGLSCTSVDFQRGATDVVTCDMPAGQGINHVAAVLQVGGRISFASNFPLAYNECQPGTRISGASCTPCDPGTFSTLVGATECTACPAGQFQPASGARSCLLTDVNNFQDLEGQSVQKACVGNTVSLVRGSVACVPCPAGTFFNAGSCQECDPGTFQDQTGQSSCTACPAGRFGAGPGLLECTPCSRGLVTTTTGQELCVGCPAGQFSDTTSSCAECPVGSFSENAGAFECIECSAGQFQDQTGQQSCQDCPAGSFQDAAGQDACDLCPVGKFSIVLGSAVCIDCSPGKAINTEGATDCDACGPGTFAATRGLAECQECAAGSFAFGEFSSVCTRCSPGSEQPTPGQASCTSCQAGTFSEFEGAPSCTNCPPGKFSDVAQAVCTPCEPGFFANETGSGACSPCLAGTFAPSAGAVECTPCPAGTSQPADQGTECFTCDPGKTNTRLGQSECVLCEPGRFSSGLELGGACTACDVGFFASGFGNFECSPCQAGRSTLEAGVSECTACTPGRFSATEGASGCQPCGPGTFSSTTGSTFCQACPLGKSGVNPVLNDTAPQSGLAACFECQAGRQATQEGSFRCDICQPGSFSVAGDAAGCQTCPTGTAQPFEGSSFCYQCDATTGSTSLASRIDCDCPISFFALSRCKVPNATVCDPLDEGSLFSCERCPLGSRCDNRNVNQENIEAAPGFFEINELDYLPCLLPEHCLGGLESECGFAREGPLCAKCQDGFTSGGVSASGECEKCPPEGDNTPLLVVIGGFILFSSILVGMFYVVVKSDGGVMKRLRLEMAAEDALADKPVQELSREEMIAQEKDRLDDETDRLGRYRVTKLNDIKSAGTLKVLTLNDYDVRSSRAEPNYTFKMKIVLSFMQIISSLSFALDAPWPNLFRKFLQLFAFVNLDFLPWQSIGCLAKLDYYDKVLFIGFVPIFASLLLVFFYVIPLHCWTLRQKVVGDQSKYKVSHKRRMEIAAINNWKLFQFTLFLLYPFVSSMVLKMFICRNVNDTFRLQVDFALECFDETWFSNLPLILVLVLLYPIGIPVIFFFLLCANRPNLAQTATRARLGFLYGAFYLSTWWFELACISYKLVMTSVLGFFIPELQMPVGMAVSLIFLALILVCKPYLRKGEDRLHILCVTEITLLIQSVYIIADEGNEWDQALDVIVSIGLIAMCISCLVVGVFMVTASGAKIVRGKMRRRRLKRMGKTQEDDDDKIFDAHDDLTFTSDYGNVVKRQHRTSSAANLDTSAQ